jgi:LysR family transcriptional regulator, hydrogen peroxide-inducible genes activator
MPRLRDAFPKLKVYLREEQTAPLLARLEAGRLDAVVLALPFALGEAEAQDVATDRFCVVCPKGHRFEALGAVRPGDLATEDLLLLEDGHCMRDHALAACALERARRNIAFQGAGLYTLVQMVAGGLGVTLVPQIAIAAGILRGLAVAVAPLAGDAPSRTIALAWRRASGRKETFRRLAATLGESMSPSEWIEALKEARG